MAGDTTTDGARGDDTATAFRTQGYVAVPGLMPPTLLAYLKHYVRIREASGGFFFDAQCPRSVGLGGDAALDAVLELLRPTLSRKIGLDLAPTYSYCRIYGEGEDLFRHRDRVACEVSVTIAIHIPPGFPESSLWVMSRDGVPVEMPMTEGDGCLYGGAELEHWRRPLTQGGLVQLFLHYVNKDGPFYPEWLNDKRKTLGVPYG